MERTVVGSGDQEIGNQVACGTFYEKKKSGTVCAHWSEWLVIKYGDSAEQDIQSLKTLQATTQNIAMTGNQPVLGTFGA